MMDKNSAFYKGTGEYSIKYLDELESYKKTAVFKAKKEALDDLFYADKIGHDQLNDGISKLMGDFATEFRIKPENKDYFISQYATVNNNEFIAEAFAEYKLSSNPSKAAIEIGQLLDKHYKGANP